MSVASSLAVTPETAPAAAVSPASGKGLSSAILFVSRASIRPMVRQELKNAGIGILFNVDTLEACVDHLGRHPQALLVVDWDHGPETVNAALRAAHGAFGIDTRAIFMIAAELSRTVVATAAEYYVARVHTGEVSRGSMQEHIDALVDQESQELGFRAMLTRVADARRRGERDTALNLLSELQARHPDDKRLICELAEACIAEERWQDAQRVLEQLGRTEHPHPRIAHLRARCLMRRGDFAQAATLLQESHLANPFHVDRLVDLGKALLQIDRVREALASFEAALRLAPDHQEASQGRMQCQLLAGEVNEALTLMRQMSSPRELASLFNSAAVLSVRHGRFEHGLSLYRTAIGALGSASAGKSLIARLLYNLGLAYHKQGRLAVSLECFEKAVAIDASFDKARHNALVISLRLGRDGEGESAAFWDEEKLTPAETR